MSDPTPGNNNVSPNGTAPAPLLQRVSLKQVALGTTIVVLVLAFNTLGDGLRDAFNLDIEPFGR